MSISPAEGQAIHHVLDLRRKGWTLDSAWINAQLRLHYAGKRWPGQQCDNWGDVAAAYAVAFEAAAA